MNIVLKQTKEEELEYLTELEKISFAVNGKYFENGIIPPLSEEERKAYSLKTLYKEKNVVILSIYLEDEIVGCAVVKDVNSSKKEIVLFLHSINAKSHPKNISLLIKAIEVAYKKPYLLRNINDLYQYIGNN